MITPVGDNSSAGVWNVSRRALLTGALAAGGLVLAVGLARHRIAHTPRGTVNDPRVFVSIATDGRVTIICHRSEMGQGVRTSLPIILADELEADWGRVSVVQAPGDETKFGNQDTDGSRSIRDFMMPMRQAGAAARMMLEEVAARRWAVPASDVEATNHEVVQKSTGNSFGYGELAADASKVEAPPAKRLRLKDPSQFRYIGKDGINNVDAFDVTTGRAQYGQDVRLPGQKCAVIARPPVMGGKVVSHDPTDAKKIPGVVQIVEIPTAPSPPAFLPSGGIAIVANNTWAAIQGRAALKIVWDHGPHQIYDSNVYRAEMEATARQPGKVLRSEGDATRALEGADKRVVAEYYIPHLAHATMEPPSATARIVDGKAEIWTSVQSPQTARDLVAKVLGFSPENVTVNVMLSGGGFGRKSKPDYVAEAALISKAIGGAAVKVVWTREDDIHNDFYHTVSVERLEGGLDDTGKIVAWRHNSVAPTISSLFKSDPKHESNSEAAMGLVDMPFQIENLSIENGEAEAHTKIGWFRSISNISHAFAIQSFVGELAIAAGKDHRSFILELIGPPRVVDLGQAKRHFWDHGDSSDAYLVDTGRLRNVLELATKEAGWGRKLPQGHGLGLAVHRSFGSYVAVVIDAAVDEGGVTVPRIDIAVDCGPIVDPDRVRAQMEGAAIMGLSLALKSEISFKSGRVLQNNFDDYRVLRMSDAPRETHVHIVPRGYDFLPGGVGEPGVPPIAPALFNAIHVATGKRIRTLPLGEQSLKA
jgi:isoquinoline 1-oxidoreductase beta subunit